MEIKPAFGKHNVPLIFASNEYFVPYLSVMLLSIIKHGQIKCNYDILILHQDITQASQILLKKMSRKYNNISIRFLNVTQYIKDYTFYTENRDFFSAEAYFRLLTPFLLTEYSKVIYMDGDMIAMTDVAELMKVDLSHYLIAAVRDYCGLADVYAPDSDRMTYMTQILKLENYNDYYISGLLVMNLEEFRKKFTMKQLMDLAVSQKWKFHDQDILNQLTQGQTILLDARWNVLQNYGKHKGMPVIYYNEWKKSRSHPYIIHFGGIAKPWRYPRVPWGNYFWRYAKKSPFYKVIQERKRQELQTDRLTKMKYYIHYIFPMGSSSRSFVYKLSQPLWIYIKRKLEDQSK